MNHNSRIYNSKKVIIFAHNVDIPATVELHVSKQKERFTWPFYRKKLFPGKRTINVIKGNSSFSTQDCIITAQTVELHVLKQKERFTWPFYKKKAFSRQANNKCKGKFFIQYTRRHNRHPKCCHPYIHWYFYNQNMDTSLYALRRSSSNLDTIIIFTY